MNDKDIKEIHCTDEEGNEIIIKGNEIYINGTKKETNDNKKDTVEVKEDGIYINGKKFVKKPSKLQVKTASLLWSFSIIAYITLSLVIPTVPFPSKIDGWALYWIVFLAAIVIDSIFISIRKKNLNHFNYPVLMVGLYMFLGLGFELWHPYWFLFLTIPAWYMLINAFKIEHEE